jgi:integrase/recombinase XerD
MRLEVAVEEYVARKRLLGRRYEHNSKELRAFVRRYPLALAEVRVAHVSAFLNRSRLARGTWIGRYSRLQSFFRYWMAKHEISRLPMPRPKRPSKRIFSPYIYSRSDIRQLLGKAGLLERESSVVRAHTLRALIIFLYGSGAGIGEALALQVKDVDWEMGTITLSARIGPPRTIPIGADLLEFLKKYVQIMKPPGAAVFCTKDGQSIKEHRIKVVFRRVRRAARISRIDSAAHQPMLRDFRHTFAVHRITDWYEKGLEVENMLPRLAAYMGVWNLKLVNRYLSLVPAHFRQQIERLEKETDRSRYGHANVRFRSFWKPNANPPVLDS